MLDRENHSGVVSDKRVAPVALRTAELYQSRMGGGFSRCPIVEEPCLCSDRSPTDLRQHNRRKSRLESASSRDKRTLLKVIFTRELETEGEIDVFNTPLIENKN